MLRYDIRTGVKKIKTKTFMAISGASLASAGLVIALAMPLSAKAASSAVVVVTDSNPGAWTVQDTSCSATPATGSQMMVNGPATPPAGSGSREFQIGANGDTFETYRNPSFAGTKLSDLTQLSYSTYVQSGGTGDQAPYILLNIDNDGNGTLDDQLFFEPTYQNGYTSNVPTQAKLTSGEWQTWDALNGGWWSTSTPGVGPGSDVKTLAFYVTQHQNATIINGTDGAGGFRVATGCGAGAWDNFVGNADNVAIGVTGNSTTYDFELQLPAPTSKDQCMNSSWKTFGSTFKNQGDCVSFVATNGKNQPSGPAKH